MKYVWFHNTIWPDDTDLSHMKDCLRKFNHKDFFLLLTHSQDKEVPTIDIIRFTTEDSKNKYNLDSMYLDYGLRGDKPVWYMGERFTVDEFIEISLLI